MSSPNESSLAYRALDEQVLKGRADEPAFTDESGTLSYAQLLHESASVAGALKQVGVEAGTAVSVATTCARRYKVIVLLGLVRLGAEPVEQDADFSFEGNPPGLRVPTGEPIPWTTLQQFGRTDPAPARPADDEGYEAAVLAAHGDVFDTLLSGGTLS